MQIKTTLGFFSLWFCLNFLFSNFVLANTVEFEQKNKQFVITQNCPKENECDYFYKTANSKKEKTIINGVRKGAVSWIDNDTAQIFINLGTYNNAVFFVNAEKGVFFVNDLYLVDTRFQCAVSADNKGIYFYKLYNSKKMYSLNENDKKFNFMKVATLLSLIDGKFTENGDFLLSYIDAEDVDQTKIIKTPCGR